MRIFVYLSIFLSLILNPFVKAFPSGILAKNQAELSKKMWQFAGFADVEKNISRKKIKCEQLLDSNIVNDFLNKLAHPSDKVFTCEDYEYVSYLEDVANGFLVIEASSGPCGCYDKHYVAAFKKQNGRYIFLKNKRANCWKPYSASASVPWKAILPKELSTEYFYRKGEKVNKSRAIFFFELDVPKKKKNVTLHIKPILNWRIAYTNRLLFEPVLDNESGGGMDSDVSTIVHFFNYMDEHKLLTNQHIANKKYFNQNELNELSKKIYLAMSAGSVKDIESNNKALRRLYNAYIEMLKLDTQRVVLSWDAKQGKFIIQEKHKMIPPKSFIEFLKSEQAITLSC